jgi:hypothetical protein
MGSETLTSIFVLVSCMCYSCIWAALLLWVPVLFLGVCLGFGVELLQWLRIKFVYSCRTTFLPKTISEWKLSPRLVVLVPPKCMLQR